MTLTINFDTDRVNEIEYAIKEVARLVGEGYSNGILDDGSIWFIEN